MSAQQEDLQDLRNQLRLLRHEKRIINVRIIIIKVAYWLQFIILTIAEFLIRNIVRVREALLSALEIDSLN